MTPYASGDPIDDGTWIRETIPLRLIPNKIPNRIPT